MSLTSETDRVVTALARSYIERGEAGPPNSADAAIWWLTLTREERRLFDGERDLLLCVQYRAKRLAEGAA